MKLLKRLFAHIIFLLIVVNFIEEDTIICECCETPVRTENAITVGDLGNYVCPECAKKYTKICGKCGHRYYDNEFFWDQESGKFICEWCKKDLEEEEKVESCLKLKTHREPLFIQLEDFHVPLPNYQEILDMNGGENNGTR